MANSAEESLSKHLGISLPLPLVAQKSLEWALKQSDIDKESLYQEILDNIYRNDHSSLEDAIARALDGFNVTERG